MQAVLRKIIRASDLYSRRIQKLTGLTYTQFLVMQAIENLGEVTIREVSEEVSLSQATVTTVLDRLEDRKLLVRRRSTEDRRRVHARLTKAGQEALERAPDVLQDGFARQIESLPDWERHLLLYALHRVADMIDASGSGEAPVPRLEIAARNG